MHVGNQQQSPVNNASIHIKQKDSIYCTTLFQTLPGLKKHDNHTSREQTAQMHNKTEKSVCIKKILIKSEQRNKANKTQMILTLMQNIHPHVEGSPLDRARVSVRERQPD